MKINSHLIIKFDENSLRNIFNALKIKIFSVNAFSSNKRYIKKTFL